MTYLFVFSVVIIISALSVFLFVISRELHGIGNKYRCNTKTLRQVKKELSESPLAEDMLRDLKERNSCIFTNGDICHVLCDRVETPVRTYIYSDYNLNDFYQNECKELAVFLASFYTGRAEITEIAHIDERLIPAEACRLNADGNVTVVKEYDPIIFFEGYELRAE